ncbi:DUF3102 domain-containing protein [Bradyrhizobium japonicum]|uniref:DUF3102 domain-containing protein n=1 Tax=Bradyrhizobium japonicum TaxID=375 RepID=UPI0009B81730|nr:DUF3102 domain-containing protein [Bradyrhizobium japonicum]
MSKSVSKTRAQWAKEICAAHHKSIENVLQIGRTLTAAKKALPYGEFENMIATDLPFEPATAQRLMKIARDPRIAKAARAQLLPIAWGKRANISSRECRCFEKSRLHKTQPMAGKSTNQFAR